MYYALFSSLKTAREKRGETSPNQCCNTLICAVSQLLQHADVGYKLPSGVRILHQSMGKVHQILLMLAVLKMCVMWICVKKRRRLFGDITSVWPRDFNPPEELPWSAICKKKKNTGLTQIHSALPPIPLSGKAHLLPPRETSRLSCLRWKSICLTAAIYPAVRRSQTPRPYSIVTPNLSQHQPSVSVRSIHYH